MLGATPVGGDLEQVPGYTTAANRHTEHDGPRAPLIGAASELLHACAQCLESGGDISASVVLNGEGYPEHESYGKTTER